TPEFYLRIRKSNPYFIHLICCEKTVDKFDLSSEESYIIEVFFERFFSTEPKPRTFDIDTNKVFFGKRFRQSYGIFAFATTQFQHYRMVVFKDFAPPFTF